MELAATASGLMAPAPRNPQRSHAPQSFRSQCAPSRSSPPGRRYGRGGDAMIGDGLVTIERVDVRVYRADEK
jgi:hypothetical protein